MGEKTSIQKLADYLYFSYGIDTQDPCAEMLRIIEERKIPNYNMKCHVCGRWGANIIWGTKQTAFRLCPAHEDQYDSLVNAKMVCAPNQEMIQ